MRTVVVGEDAAIFTALREAFAKGAEAGHLVMSVTVSNACPLPTFGAAFVAVVARKTDRPPAAG